MKFIFGVDSRTFHQMGEFPTGGERSRWNLPRFNETLANAQNPDITFHEILIGSWWKSWLHGWWLVPIFSWVVFHPLYTANEQGCGHRWPERRLSWVELRHSLRRHACCFSCGHLTWRLNLTHNERVPWSKPAKLGYPHNPSVHQHELRYPKPSANDMVFCRIQRTRF